MKNRSLEIETTKEHNTSLDRHELFAAYMSKEPYVFEILEILSNLDNKSRRLMLSIAQVLDISSMAENQIEQSSGTACCSLFMKMPFLNYAYTARMTDQFLSGP